MKVFRALVLFFFASLAFESASFAACSIAVPGDCLPTIGGDQDRNTITLLNKCNKPIRAAVNYLPSPSNDAKTWRKLAWYNLAPGAKAFIGYSHTRYFYTYAETPDGATTWKGDQCFVFSDAGNRTLCTKQVDMGSKITNFTYNFSCN